MTEQKPEVREEVNDGVVKTGGLKERMERKKQLEAELARLEAELGEDETVNQIQVKTEDLEKVREHQQKMVSLHQQLYHLEVQRYQTYKSLNEAQEKLDAEIAKLSEKYDAPQGEFQLHVPTDPEVDGVFVKNKEREAENGVQPVSDQRQ